MTRLSVYDVGASRPASRSVVLSRVEQRQRPRRDDVREILAVLVMVGPQSSVRVYQRFLSLTWRGIGFPVALRIGPAAPWAETP
jgi:hypothetical protein